MAGLDIDTVIAALIDGSPMGRKATGSGASAATVAAPPQLQPILLALPHLDEQAFAMALANDFMKVDPASDRSAELELKLHQVVP